MQFIPSAEILKNEGRFLGYAKPDYDEVYVWRGSKYGLTGLGIVYFWFGKKENLIKQGMCI